MSPRERDLFHELHRLNAHLDSVLDARRSIFTELQELWRADGVTLDVFQPDWVGLHLGGHYGNRAGERAGGRVD